MSFRRGAGPACTVRLILGLCRCRARGIWGGGVILALPLKIELSLSGRAGRVPGGGRVGWDLNF